VATRRHAERRLLPEDAVVHQRPGGLQDEVVDPQAGKADSDEENQSVLDEGARHV
jgi:hypothetical protein